MATVSTGIDDTESKKPVVAAATTTTTTSNNNNNNSNNSNSQINSPRLSTGGFGKQTNVLSSPNDNNEDGNDDREKRNTPLLRTGTGELPEASENAAIDPLSQHILKRTQTERSITYKLKNQPHLVQESGGDGSKISPTDQVGSRSEAFPLSSKPSKEKKKGVSFLSRIIGTKKSQPVLENYSNDSASQTEAGNGKNDIFAHPIGFIPRFPPPPKYIKVRAHFKKHKAFDRVFLAQELNGAGDDSAGDEGKTEKEAKSKNNAIWAMVFSKDGKYLAAAGQDKIVRVWAVITNTEDREAHEQEEDEIKGDEGLRLTAPVFKAKPIREYHGHTGSVLDLSWSKNNFLLSSSMDRTVRLWHVSREECLCCFKHSDFVTSIQFHPRDDRFFLAGSLDSKLRLWSIPDKSVAFWATVRDMITSVAFTPDGKYSIAGCLNGLCILYETDGLKANSQVHVRSARGRNAKGSKITGIDTIMHPPNDPNGNIKLLITSNDSRIRLYNFKDCNLEAKYRGNENSTSQIRASFSDDGKYIICGSEDKHTYIWPTGAVDKESGKLAMEELETRTDIVTCAVMAPTSTRQSLGFSGDPLYDLCNPPPVTLVSNVDSTQSSKYSDDQKDRPKRGTDIEFASNTAKAQGSPAYLARSLHSDGNIILAADYSGRIKVFRQDCAYNKRPSDWDANATFSKRLLRRSNSARHSIASSIGRESKTPSERILAWRSSVTGTELASIDSPIAKGTRTPSPRKSGYRLRLNSSEARTESGYATPLTHPVGDNASDVYRQRDAEFRSIKDGSNLATESGSEASFESGLEMNDKNKNKTKIPQFNQSSQSNAFWTRSAADLKPQRPLHPDDAFHVDDGEGGPVRRRSSVPSMLSSDLASSIGSNDHTVSNNEVDESEVLRCPRCRGTNFRATKTKGKQKLVCVRCDTIVG